MKDVFKIGVISNSFRLSVRDGVRQVKAVGADGFQIYAVRGEMSPDAMDAASRLEFRSFVADLGLEIAALCGDSGHYAFYHEDERARGGLDLSKRIVDLAVDLGTKVVTTHVGVVPADPASPTRRIMLAACRELARHAAARGVTFAIETGPEKAEVLRALLDELDTPGIGVNLDPANLAMVAGDDPVKAVRTLARYIVHTHAKDGVQVKPHDPREVYGLLPEDPPDLFPKRQGPLYREVPLGEGAVDWPAYLRALKDIGYRGYLTIEREVGDNPARDIAAAVEFLREKLGGKARH